jgi:hypothetical protein
MIDSDNVLLLRPARSDSGFRLENLKRPSLGSKEGSNALIVSTIYYLNRTAQDNCIQLVERELVPRLTKAGGSIVGMFVTEDHPNTFPALPVREGENVFLSFARFANRQAYDEFAGSNSVHEFEASAHIKGKSETVLLVPTSRSLLR